MSLVRVQHRPLLFYVNPCPSGVYVFVGIALDVDALHFEWDEGDERRELLHFALGKNDAKMRVVPRLKWDEIAEATKAEFNRRLREGGPTGQWQTGQVPVARLCGKELVPLAWAIEDADPAKVPTAIRNWAGTGAGGTVVALHDGQCGDGTRCHRAQRRLAEGRPVRAHRKSRLFFGR